MTSLLPTTVDQMQEIFTIGHGARPWEEFVSLLKAAEIALLVDVRRHPGSRRHPHFSKDELGHQLSAHGVTYEWWGETLGGRRKPDQRHDRHVAWRNASFRAYAAHMETREFRDSLEELKRRAESFRLAIMCAETLWWRCHRRLIADALVVGGFDVIHLGLGDDKHHALTQSARVEDNDALVYDLDP